MADQHDWMSPIVDAVASHALRTGRLEQVNQHEPERVPGTGITGAVWGQDVFPTREASGLNTTSALLVLTFRLYSNRLMEPRDAVDPALVAALSALWAQWHGDLTLGGKVMTVDVFGAHGRGPLSAQAGWIRETRQRIYTCSVPLVVPDVWTQGS